jgi:hypothetical protein
MSEAALHAAIARAHAAGAVQIAIDPAVFRRSQAPGFRTTDIVVPPFVIVVLSAYLLVYQGPAAGGTGLAAGLLFWWFVVRPWNRRRAEERVRGLALAKLEHWSALWAMGGLTLRKGDVTCAAPGGDWRDFARAHLAGAA